MRSVYDDDAGGSFYCRFGLDAMQAGSGRSMRGERGKARSSQKCPGPPRNGTRVLSITWIDTVRITASRFGSCVGNLYEEGKGQKAIERGSIRVLFVRSGTSQN
jgi:hypothetical protein